METTKLASLREKVSTSKVAQDVMHVLASRQKSRHCLTLAALNYRMGREGFNHPMKDYGSVLKLISEAGFARLETDKKGNPKALRDIKVTLNSLGRAMIQQKERIAQYTQRNQFKDIVETAKMIKTSPTQLEVHPFRVSGTVSITLSINGKPVIIPVPAEFTPEEITGLIKKLQDNTKE